MYNLLCLLSPHIDSGLSPQIDSGLYIIYMLYCILLKGELSETLLGFNQEIQNMSKVEFWKG